MRTRTGLAKLALIFGLGVAACTASPGTSIESQAAVASTSPSTTVSATASETATASSTPAGPTPTPIGRFVKTGSMTTPRWGHTATLLRDGRVLMVGGLIQTGQVEEFPNVWTASAELYEPKTGKFKATGSMAQARIRHTATLLPDGRVLIAGGSAGDVDSLVLASAELYDPQTGKFTPTGSMTTARERHTATLLADGRVLMAGGRSGYTDAGSQLASAELYDPQTGKFSPTGPMAAAREEHTATLLADGRVLVAGGSGDGETLASAELYDPVRGAFEATGPMTGGRWGHSAALLHDGRVLVTATLQHPAVDVYDPVSGTFTPTGSPTAEPGEDLMPATVLEDGRVLVMGLAGLYDLVTHTFIRESGSAELYDPPTGMFVPAGSPISAGWGPSATLLQDGRVLVAGGQGRKGGVSASAELYLP